MFTVTGGDAVRILLVEDDPAAAAQTSAALRGSKVANDTSVVRTDAEVMAYLRAEPPYLHVERPDLIVIDVSSQGRDRSTLVARLKQDPQLRTLPVVALAQDSAEAERLVAGADYVLAKPLELHQFLRVIASIDTFGLSIVKLTPRLA